MLKCREGTWWSMYVVSTGLRAAFCSARRIRIITAACQVDVSKGNVELNQGYTMYAPRPPS